MEDKSFFLLLNLAFLWSSIIGGNISGGTKFFLFIVEFGILMTIHNWRKHKWRKHKWRNKVFLLSNLHSYDHEWQALVVKNCFSKKLCSIFLLLFGIMLCRIWISFSIHFLPSPCQFHGKFYVDRVYKIYVSTCSLIEKKIIYVASSYRPM